MWPWLKSLGGPLLDAATSIWQTGQGREGQKDTNAANAAQAQKQMDFQERMSNTSYQRQVADLRAAGLNPALAYQAGGANAPPGASATMGNVATSGADYASKMAGILSAVSQARNTDANTRQTNIESQARLEELQGRVKNINQSSAEGVARTSKLNAETIRELLGARYDDESLAGRLELLQTDINRGRTSARDTAAGATLKEQEATRGALKQHGYDLLNEGATITEDWIRKNFMPMVNGAREAKRNLDVGWYNFNKRRKDYPLPRNTPRGPGKGGSQRQF